MGEWMGGWMDGWIFFKYIEPVSSYTLCLFTVLGLIVLFLVWFVICGPCSMKVLQSASHHSTVTWQQPWELRH